MSLYVCIAFSLYQVHIFQDFLVGRSEKNNNYFVATFQKISFEQRTAPSNLVTPCAPAQRDEPNKRIHKNKIT